MNPEFRFSRVNYIEGSNIVQSRFTKLVNEPEHSAFDREHRVGLVLSYRGAFIAAIRPNRFDKANFHRLRFIDDLCSSATGESPS